MSNIKKNLGYQTVYEILNTCLPLITAPYLARVLGASQLGVYSYTQSIVNYFVLIAMLGVKNYGTRSIAAVKTDETERTKRFNEIFSLQLISSCCAFAMYALYCLFICRDNYLIAYIQALAVFSCIFDINWLFSGLEQFKITVIRSTIVRVLTVALILLLVKERGDLWIYTVLMLGGTLIGSLVLWGFVPKMVNKLYITISGVKKHIKPNLILFLPLMAMSVYHLMDKTMLGYLSTYEQTGYYYNSDKIINIPIGILIGIGTVMLPRITYLVNSGRGSEANQLFLVSIEGVSACSFAMTFGIIAVTNEFVPLFFGPGYDACILLTIVLAPVLFIKALSLTVRNAFLIPYGFDKVYVHSVLVGALFNLIINILLIPKYGALGAVIGTVVAESIACIWQIISIRKTVKIVKKIVMCFPYLMFGLIMVMIVRLFSRIIITMLFFKVLIEIVIGGLVYIIMCYLYWKKTSNELISFFGVKGSLSTESK